MFPITKNRKFFTGGGVMLAKEPSFFFGLFFNLDILVCYIEATRVLMGEANMMTICGVLR